MNYCKNPNCKPCRLMRVSERDANHKIRQLQREAQYVNLISERARVKQRDISQKIREVEWETTELKIDIALAAMKKEKEIRQQAATERRQQAWSALAEQEKQEANRQARERLLPALLEEVTQACERTLAAAEEKMLSSQNQYQMRNQSIPTTLHSCGPACGSALTSASRPLTTYHETPRLPSRSRFLNIQKQRRSSPCMPSEITHRSFCRCYSCYMRLHTQEITTKLDNSGRDKAYWRRKLNIPHPVEVEVEADTPTCSGAVNEKEDVWEKYVRDDPKAKKAALKSPAKRDRYPKRVSVVSQDEEEGESEKENSTAVKDEGNSELEDGVEVVEKQGEKVVDKLKEGKDSEEEKKSNFEEETEDQDQVRDDELSTYSSEEELATIGPGEDAN